jgi:hypothetical protein
LSGAFGEFRNKASQLVHIETGLQEPKEHKISGQSPVVLQGCLLCPDIAGRYIGRLALDSDQAGAVALPITLEVQD